MLQESTVAKRAQIKLDENTRKLQVSFTLTKKQFKFRNPMPMYSRKIGRKKQKKKDRTYLFTFLTWQGINLRATDMQDTAKSFSSLAKQVLRTSGQDRRS